MRKSRFFASTALYGLAFGGSLALASPVFAQEATAEDEAPATSEGQAVIDTETPVETPGEAILVTGSRIRRPNLESAVPVTSIGGEEFFQTGQTSVGDVLNELPALRSTFSQSNSNRFLGTAGLNLLDLRGLGTQRTLVLQNGRRHVPGDILNTAASVDVNQIPTDLIERVDVVTGGNSAIYGSDAIAGVVNFVLKRDYEGLQLRGQGGVSKYGDLGNYYVSALGGTNFAGGRGNIAVNLEYARQNDAYASGRPNLRVNSRFVTVDVDTPSAPSDDVYDNIFYKDVRFPFYNNGGDFITCCETGANNYPNFVSYLFQRDGSLVRQTGDLIGTANSGTRLLGGNGSTAREGKAVILSPVLDRYSANLIAHFTISPAFEPFIEAKYVRTDSRGSTSGPFFFDGGSTGSPRELFYTNNPYLHPQARAFLQDYYGVGPDDEQPFYMTRTVTDLGNRDEKATRETYRIVAGVRGTFNDDWSYEVSGNYGALKEDTVVLGNIDKQRFLLSIDAVRDPATGRIVCRSQIDPSARIPFEFAANSALAQQRLANDVAQCAPANLFGEGNLSAEARNYMLQDTVAKGKITQLVFNGFVSGDSSAWFELPGGPIGFALGAEYRRETAFYEQDPLVEAGLTFYNAIPSFDPPSFEVKEAFGEIRLPILANMPFAHELTLSAAGRVADYKGSTGTVFAWNAGAEWAPVRDLRFRGNFSRAVRAPNLVDLYTPLGENFAFIDDPCAEDFIANGTANRETNCRAAGVPAGFNAYQTDTVLYQSGGNPDLAAETSDSWTVGGVFQPRFLPGFSLSVDYYNITVNDVITSPTAEQIVQACYDLPSGENPFCGQFERAGPGGGPRGEAPFQLLEGSLRAIPFNYAKLKVRGIDVEAAYRRNFDGIGTVNTRLTYTHALQNDSFLDPTDPDFADQLLLELGDPKDAFNWNLDLQSGPVSIGYQMRYIGKMVTFLYEDFFSKQGRAPQNPDVAEQRFYPSVFYHDLRLGLEVGKKFNFYIGVDNVTNRKPPLGLTGVGAGSGIYSNIGRFFYAGAVAKF